MKFRVAKRLFLQSKESSYLSLRTIEYYDSWLTQFCLYLTDREIEAVEEVFAEDIEGYLLYLRNEKEIKGISVHGAFRAIRAWFNYLQKREYIEKNPVKKVDAPKVEQKVARTFTAKEIKQMLSIFDKNTFHGIRDFTILSVFFGTGLRKQEVCNLNIVDVNFDTTFIKVHGKGNKERLVPMGFGIVKIIRDYMKWRKYIETDENALFTTVEGKRIGLWTMQSIFRRIKKKSGLTGERISCATSRHTFAKDYLLNGGDIFSLQKILGHSNIATTKKYLNLNENEVREQYQKFNPLDNRDWML